MTAKLDQELLQAVGHALAGDWERAHVIVQEHDADPIAGWIHGVVHRMEGDEGNARYWYGRSGRRWRANVPLDAELREIEAELRRRPAP
jgi:hypothetical protein